MRIKKEMKLYMPFAINVFQKNLSYKANVIIYVIGDCVMLAVTYFLWSAIYRSSSTNILNGFNFNEMIVYVLISFLTAALINTDVSYGIMSEVKDGSIAINLIRPIDYKKRMLFQAFGDIFFNFILIFIIGFIGVTIYSYYHNLKFNIYNLLGYFASVSMGILLNFFYSYSFGLLSFKLTNMWGITQIMGAIMQLLSGMLIPIIFFPSFAQTLFKFLPFSSMIYTPTMIYLGKISGKELVNALLLQFIWIIILSFLSKIIWNKLIKQLVILGG